eukprot:2462371-Alexandrium_andersonii.AAC.1
MPARACPWLPGMSSRVLLTMMLSCRPGRALATWQVLAGAQVHAFAQVVVWQPACGRDRGLAAGLPGHLSTH